MILVENLTSGIREGFIQEQYLIQPIQYVVVNK